MLPVTSTIAAIMAIALIALSIPVSVRRVQVGAKVGLGNDETLLRRSRAQGNFTEYVPLALIVLGLAEYHQAAPVLLWVIAGLLVAGRAFHAAGMITGKTTLRVPGMIGTYLALLTGALTLLFG